MYSEYFPPCPIDGPIDPPGTLVHMISIGGIPRKCSSCMQFFEGSCRRHDQIFGGYKHLDHGPCPVVGPTDPVSPEDTSTKKTANIPRKCSTCEYLAFGSVWRFHCTQDSNKWGSFHRGLDWGSWQPSPIEYRQEVCKGNTKALLEHAYNGDTISFLKEYKGDRQWISFIKAETSFINFQKFALQYWPPIDNSSSVDTSRNEIEFVEFCKQNIWHFIHVISSQYKFENRSIIRLRSILDWNALSLNRHLPWSEAFISEHGHELNWSILSRNVSLPWDDQFLEKYRWNWDGLSQNWNIPWTVELLLKYSEKLNWEKLQLYAELPWSLDMISKLEDKLDWNRLSLNRHIPWSEKFVEKYIEKWHWPYLSCNDALPWSEEFVQKLHTKWDWPSLSTNWALPWSEEFLLKYEDKWDWDLLSGNIGLPWSEDFLQKYKGRWNWNRLGNNEGLPWSEEFLDKYIENWGWAGMSMNEALPWSTEFFKKYEGKWVWKSLRWNKKLPWSIDLFEEHPERDWDWEGLSANESLPWSKDFYQKHRDRWNRRNLLMNYNVGLIFLPPELTDEIICEILDP